MEVIASTSDILCIVISNLTKRERRRERRSVGRRKGGSERERKGRRKEGKPMYSESCHIESTYTEHKKAKKKVLRCHEL